ncbi:MAG TPA: molybdenum cofactor guanylyltransferase [Candidatus Limnocylindria bacterium]|jgi:molybdopterin-guanine dinucleotide biosynthesis protein A|nr:molybdenum cofactor guanylyltransferase [Candidatus Limnocylindria bacterium]
MTPHPSFTGVLLAGGQSRRMGFDKALLPIGNQTLMHRQLALLQAAGASEIWLSCGASPDFRPLPAGVPVRLIRDVFPNSGPLAGIAAALEIAREERVFVLAVDMPGITEELVRCLLSLSPERCGVAPVIEGRYETVSAVYPRCALAQAEQFLRTGQFGLQRFIALGVEEGWMKPWPVPLECLAAFVNWNSPEDVTGSGTIQP